MFSRIAKLLFRGDENDGAADADQPNEVRINPQQLQSSVGATPSMVTFGTKHAYVAQTQTDMAKPYDSL
jgi:hypothetical protein